MTLPAPIEAPDHAEIFRDHGFTEEFADLGEIRMNHVRLGTGPPLLLIPGQTESWWGYAEALPRLAEHFTVYAVDLRGQGRSTWTPGRYSLNLMGNDLVRFIDRVIGEPTYVSGLSSGGVLSLWLGAYADAGQVLAVLGEDPPVFASEVSPAVGPGLGNGLGPLFASWHQWLGNQWSKGDYAGWRAALPTSVPLPLLRSLRRMLGEPDPDEEGEEGAPPQNLLEYDPEWADAFVSGRIGANCDHTGLLASMRVPVLLTQHFHEIDEPSGHLLGASSDEQMAEARRLIEGAGQPCTFRSFPDLPHAMHSADPELFTRLAVEHFLVAPRPAG